MKCKNCNNVMRLVQTSVYGTVALDNTKRTLINTYECTDDSCDCETKVWKTVDTNGKLVKSETISYKSTTNKRI